MVDDQNHKQDGDTGSSKPATKEQDLVLLHGRTDDGEGMRALRSRADHLELAEIRPVKEGKPILAGEIVKLHPRKEAPMVCDVEVQYRAGEDSDHPQSEGRSGPPNVASDRYRRNWESIFGRHCAIPDDSELN